MKKINIIYLFAIPLCYLLYKMNVDFNQTSAFFYGFAENKDTELSHDKPVLVSKILVTPGQTVTKGELLMEVKQDAIDLKIDNASTDLVQLEIENRQQQQQLLDRISQLKLRRSTKVAELEAEIQRLESTLEYNKKLLEDLQSVEVTIDSTANPSLMKINSLRQQIQLVTEPIDLEVAQLQNELRALRTPTRVLEQKIQSQIDYYKREQQKLAILAPADGIIGNVYCKEGENISSFSTLINFYERNPTLVKGYVHESLILKVQEGDSLIVSSILYPEQTIDGVVIGLGSRIVEIPERLRKMPEIKSYGREVLIRIPQQNPFLQKEKVMLNSNTWEVDNSLTSWFSVFGSSNKRREKEIESAVRLDN
jgi:multidrug resistance efflux pump